MRRHLIALLFPLPLAAQTLQPVGVRPNRPAHVAVAPGLFGPSAHPRISTMHRHMNFGMLVGSLSGLAYGFVVEPKEDYRRNGMIMTDVLVGGAAGMLAGAVSGALARTARPALTIPPDAPYAPLLTAMQRVSAYAGVGGRLGAGAGIVHAAATSDPGLERFLRILFDGTAGWLGGMAVGALVSVVR